MTITRLEEIRDAKATNEIDVAALDILLAVVNDWPTLIVDLEEYESAVDNFIGQRPTKHNIESRLKNIDFQKILGRQNL